ncbi:hypothetical protein P3T23_008781 [Paraburkholderia sp. GAS448]|uniref:hypothetical protein n=1 Tax=Paraburkholderia sp. GAS448 TaxID=3035136 RepID=UPI003D219E2E
MKSIYEVCIRWDECDAEQGTFTETAEVNCRDDAIHAVARMMAVTRDGCGPNASENEIREFVGDAENRVEYAVSLTERAFTDLQMVLADELQGRRLDPAALVTLIKENLDRVAPAAETRRAA